VEPGESLEAAARRETLEETGVLVRLTGLLRLEHTPVAGAARVRAFFLAEPVDDTPPKSTPDDESLGAEWVALEDLGRYPLRGAEAEEAIRFVASGAPMYPLTILQLEGGPFRA